MEVRIRKLIGWDEVLDAARFTVGKAPLEKEPSVIYKWRAVVSEHSPLRNLMFSIDFFDVPEWVHVHFVRHHIGVEKFVSTQRTDRTGSKIPRAQHLQGELLNFRYVINAQAIINISKLRLCHKASKESRELWTLVVEALKEAEPQLYTACVPSCIYRGFCPEFPSCGYANSTNGLNHRIHYVAEMTKYLEKNS